MIGRLGPILALLLAGWAGAVQPAPPYQGRPLAEVLTELQEEGLDLLYNTSLVPAHLRVETEPESDDPAGLVQSLVVPHGLRVEAGPAGRLLITRQRDSERPKSVLLKGQLIDATTGDPVPGLTIRLHPGAQTMATAEDGFFAFDDVPLRPTTLSVAASGYLPLRRTLATVDMRDEAPLVLRIDPLESILGKMTVTASHYNLLHSEPSGALYLSREEVDRLPHIADDVFRAVNYLPGIANGDFSARVNVRGGATDELLVVLDGMRLYDPYHLKDLLSIFSIIDSNTVNGVDFYTGAFPAEYGASNSAVMAIDSIGPGSDYRYRLGLSFVNTFAQVSGDLADGQGYWLASGRTGYLDVVLKVINEDDGLDPTYGDILAKAEWPVGSQSVMRVSTLLAGDNSYIQDRDGNSADDDDLSDADFIDAYVWAELETDVNTTLRLNHLLFAGYLERDKTAQVQDGTRLQAEVTDQREFSFFGLQQNWDWQIDSDLQLRAGWEVRSLDARYDYQGTGVLGDLVLFTTQELPIVRDRSTDLDLDGETYSLYASLRRDWSTSLATELGLRWDQQTYTGLDDEDQLSPRLNLLYRLGERTQARLGWGRFYQPQEINQLQIEDGIETFFPATLARQTVLSLQHRTEGGIELRGELYDKDYDDVRPYYENQFQEGEILAEFEADRVRIDPESSRARGVELGARGGVPGGLQWWTSYVWSKSEDRIDGDWVPRSWDQRHAVNIGLTFPVQSWDVTLAWRYHTGWPRTPVSAFRFEDQNIVLPVIGERNSDRYGIYHRMDLRASRDIPVPTGALRFYVELINLYNRSNECCNDYPIFGSSNQLGFRRLDETWLPFLPSLGLKWEF